MGLAASQTRYLGLTARMSNVEYQGQQINQARTTLANQSAALYTQLMSLKAPTAPSPYAYVVDPATLPEINWEDETAWPITEKTAQTNFFVYYSANKPQFTDFNIPLYTEVTDEQSGETSWRRTSYDEKGKVVYGDEKYTDLSEISGTFCYRTKGKNAIGEDMTYYGVQIGADENYFYDPKTNMFSPNEGVAKEDLPKNLQAFNTAAGFYDTYSKPSQVKIYSEDTDLTNVENAEPVAYASSATISANQAQYNAAMVQYEADLKEYELACDEINQKVEEIHESDKKLEMQLKQLDTEQEAVQTEMDAVKKVIDKDIEQTFKSFA